MAINFVGYHEQETDRFQTRINSNVSKTPISLEHDVLSDVIMFPESYFHSSGIRANKAVGLYSSAGDLIPSSCLHRNQENLTQLPGYIANIDKLVNNNVNGTYLYGGFLANHYGHVLTESVSRLWLYNRKSALNGILFCGAKQIGNAARSIFAELRVEVSKLIFPKEPIRFERVIIPQPSMINRIYVHEQHVKLFREGRPEVKGLWQTTRPLYLSRRLLKNDVRRVVNECELEDLLMSKGVRVEHPQYLPLQEQISLVNDHEIIVGLSGSAMHTILFSRMPKRLLHLSSSGINLNFPLLDIACNHQATYLNCVKGAKGEAEIDVGKVWSEIELMIKGIQ